MKYTCEIMIERPRGEVVALFDDPANMKHWQPELQSFEPLSGTPGQPGATSKLVYQMGKRSFEMIETITERALPDTFCGTYETTGGSNTVKNSFIEQEGKTRWICESEFCCKGLMRIMSLLMPGAFKKQTRKFMDQFKRFAESSQANAQD